MLVIEKKMYVYLCIYMYVCVYGVANIQQHHWSVNTNKNTLGSILASFPLFFLLLLFSLYALADLHVKQQKIVSLLKTLEQSSHRHYILWFFHSECGLSSQTAFAVNE